MMTEMEMRATATAIKANNAFADNNSVKGKDLARRFNTAKEMFSTLFKNWDNLYKYMDEEVKESKAIKELAQKAVDLADILVDEFNFKHGIDPKND